MAARQARARGEEKGIRVGFVGFGGGRSPKSNRAGCVSWGDTRFKQIVRRARKQCDVLVVYFHGGIEAFHYPMRTTMRACYGAVECGADLVVGTHPHTLQGMEVYRDVPVAYSLGCFGCLAMAAFSVSSIKPLRRSLAPSSPTSNCPK